MTNSFSVSSLPETTKNDSSVPRKSRQITLCQITLCHWASSLNMRLRAMKIIEALDAQAATSGQSRAEVVRQALEFALGLKR